MKIPSDTIDHVTLERLVEANAVRCTSVVGQAGGWGIVIQYGMTERALAAKRGAMLVFRRFETLVAYLKKIGIVTYQVDASDFDSGLNTTARTRLDASERMRSAHEAAAYNKWFHDQVQAALDEPRNGISNEVMEAEFSILHAELAAEANAMQKKRS